MIKNETVPYVGASISFGNGIFSYLSQETLSAMSIIIGILVALGTFLINWYYKAKEDRRAEKLFQQKLEDKHSDEQN